MVCENIKISPRMDGTFINNIDNLAYNESLLSQTNRQNINHHSEPPNYIFNVKYTIKNDKLLSIRTDKNPYSNENRIYYDTMTNNKDSDVQINNILNAKPIKEHQKQLAFNKNIVIEHYLRTNSLKDNTVNYEEYTGTLRYPGEFKHDFLQYHSIDRLQDRNYIKNNLNNCN